MKDNFSLDGNDVCKYRESIMEWFKWLSQSNVCPSDLLKALSSADTARNNSALQLLKETELSL